MPLQDLEVKIYDLKVSSRSAVDAVAAVLLPKRSMRLHKFELRNDFASSSDWDCIRRSLLGHPFHAIQELVLQNRHARCIIKWTEQDMKKLVRCCPSLQ